MPMLTDYETGDPAFCHRDDIKSAFPLPADVLPDGTQRLKRTIIRTVRGDSFIVKETVTEVMADG